MALKLFMTGAGDSVTLSDAGFNILGGAGTQTVKLTAGASNTVLDPNIERVEFVGALSAYTFKAVAGVGMQVYSGATLVSTISSTNGVTLAFANGSVAVAQTGGSAFTVGGTAVTTSGTAAVISPVTINAGDVSTVGGTVNPGTFALTPSVATTNEGTSVTFNVVAGLPNTAYGYTLTGVIAADVTGGLLTGTVTTDATGKGSFVVAIANDRVTDGVDTMVASLPNTGLSASVIINDTSTNNIAPVATAATGATTEAGAIVSGQLVATDAENDALTFTLAAPVPGLTVNANGTYSFDPSLNPTAQALTYQSAALPVVANFVVTDALGATATSTLTITVTPKPLTFKLVPSATFVEEGQTITYKLVASEAVAAAVTAEVKVVPGDGTVGKTGANDFGSGALNPQNVTIAVGATESSPFNLIPQNDAATEVPESYTVVTTVAGYTVADVVGEVRDPSTVGGVGQTFTLTTSVDTVPGLIGSAGSTGTDGDDIIVGSLDGANSTWTALDNIDGGLGNNTLRINAIADFAVPAGATTSNIQTLQINAAAKVGTFAANGTGAVDLSTTLAGVTTLSITSAAEVDFKAPTTAAVNVSGVTGGVEVVGGAAQTVNLAAQGAAVKLSGSTGAVSVTSAKQAGAGKTIDIDGGSTVNVVTTADATNGAINIGATTPATGAVSVTSNLNGNGTAKIDQADITVTGGSTVTVASNLTINAKNETAGGPAHTFGDVKVTSDSKTTAVTVNQVYAETEFTKPAVDVVKELHTVTFLALASGQDTSIDGLTFTASKALTAAEVAQAFSNLTASDLQTSGGKVANGVFTGQLSANFTSGAANGAVVVFTAKDESETLLLTAGTIDPTGTAVAGTKASAAVTSANSVTYGKVQVDGNATASVTTVTVNGYSTADLGDTGTDLNALTTLSLANGGAANVATSATTLALSVNNVIGAIDLDKTAATIKTLNVTTTGANSTSKLTAAAVETLTVAGDKALDASTSVLTNLKTVTVSGSASLTIDASGANVTAVNTAATTGAVNAKVDGSKATYTGGAGVDNVTLSSATISKAISLGNGDNSLSFGALTVTSAGAALTAGTGTDTLVMNFASADALDNTATFKSMVTGFERLTINDAASTATLDLENLGFTNYVRTTGVVAANALVLDKMANNGTVVLSAAPGAAGTIEVKITDATTGTADVLNVLTTANSTPVNYGTLTANKVEKINVTVDDVDNGVPDSHTLTLAADSVTSITIGNANDLVGTATDRTNLDLIVTGATALATVNASGMKGVFSYTAGQGVTTVTGGSGNDVLAAAGSGDTLIGGAGNDRLIGADLTTLTGGAGNDTFVINQPANVNSYSSITDLTAGDVIDLDVANAGTVVFTKSAVVLAPTAVFQDYANTAINALGTDANDAAWFQFGGNTYIVQSGNATAGNDFVNGSDSIIQIVGLVDLSTASYNQSIGTLEIA